MQNSLGFVFQQYHKRNNNKTRLFSASKCNCRSSATVNFLVHMFLLKIICCTILTTEERLAHNCILSLVETLNCEYTCRVTNRDFTSMYKAQARDYDQDKLLLDLNNRDLIDSQWPRVLKCIDKDSLYPASLKA